MRSPTPREQVDALSEWWSRNAGAMAHPTRLAILDALWERPRSASELAQIVDAPVENVSHHVGVLCRRGCLVEVARKPRPGGVRRVYALRRPAWGDERVAATLAAATPDPQASAEIVGVYEQVSSAARAGAIAHNPDDQFARHPMLLDDEGLAELEERTAELLQRIDGIVAAAGRRLAAAGGAGVGMQVAVIRHGGTR